MCGLFGAIGKGFNTGTIRALAIANRSRGTDSLGFFDSGYGSAKCAADPIDCLRYKAFNRYLRGASGAWFVAGHTRAATTGKVCNANAHPFRYGHIIGAHNGVVDLPHGASAKFAVDSELLIHNLALPNHTYQSALADVSGYWALTWFDGSDFWITTHNNSLYIGTDKASGVRYYSSTREALIACAGKLRDLTKLADGATMRFSADGSYVREAAFQSAAPRWRAWSYCDDDYDCAPRQSLGFTSGKTASTGTSGSASASSTGTSGKAQLPAKRQTSAARMSGKDWTRFNSLAVDAGYTRAGEFMLDSGILDPAQALRQLERLSADPDWSAAYDEYRHQHE